MTLSEYLNDNGFELNGIEKEFVVNKGNIRSRHCFLNSSANKKLRELSETDDFKSLGIWKSVEISFNDDNEREEFLNFCRNSDVIKVDDENSMLLNLVLENKFNPNKSTGRFGMISVNDKKITPVIIEQVDQEKHSMKFSINRGIIE